MSSSPAGVRYGYGYWAVCRRSDGTVIGFGGIARMPWHERGVLNVYYRLVPAAWGQGLAGELVAEAVRLRQAHLADLPLLVRTRPGNLAAVRVAERAGLVRRPELDDDFLVLLSADG